MSVTPFQYLKEHIYDIKFDCDRKYLFEYQRAFSAVLDRMDKYFTSTGLYKAVDYQPIVEQMLSKKNLFAFKVQENPEIIPGAAGYYSPNPYYENGKFVNKSEIYMLKEFMGRGTTTEGCLCHEFIHYLTLNPERLTYTENGEQYSVMMPRYRSGGRGYKRNLTKGPHGGTAVSFPLDGGFICEGFTELLKQQIYSEKEDFHAYNAQTNMLKFINKLEGKSNLSMFREFLRGDLPSYVDAIGRENLEKLNEASQIFHKDKKTAYSTPSKYLSDAHYMYAQHMVCDSILKDIAKNPQKYSIKEYLEIIDNIMSDTYMLSNDTYSQKYATLVAIVNKYIANSKSLDDDKREKFTALLESTIEKRRENQEGIVLPEPYNHIKIKQGINDSIQINNCTFDFEFLGLVQLNNDANYTYQMNNMPDGSYRFKIYSKDNSPNQIFKLVPNKRTPGDFIVQNENNEEITKLNFKVRKNKFEREMQGNISMLENFDLYDDIQTILSNNQDANIGNIKKITAENGETFLIVGASKGLIFYKQTPNGYVKVEVDEKQAVPEGTNVNYKFTMGEKNSMLVGYNPTGIKTEDECFSYKLSDGTSIVSYFDDKGKSQYGQQILPYSKAINPIIITTNNSMVFDRHNEDLTTLFGYDKQKEERAL
jgi:hypothetical protein